MNEKVNEKVNEKINEKVNEKINEKVNEKDDINKNPCMFDEQINNNFKLPIYYLENKYDLSENIKDDLELLKTIDKNNNPIYEYAFAHIDNSKKTDNTENTNILSKKIIPQAVNYYTDNTFFLKDTQTFLQKYDTVHFEDTYIIDNKMHKIWDDIKNDNGFKERYYYIDWPIWEFLNHSETFLQIMSIYSLASPVISLFIPIIILIIPFFVIRLKGLCLTINEYINILKIIASQHSLFKLFTDFNCVSPNEKIYLIVSAGFYIFSIYQNILTCMRFYNNMHKIHGYIQDIKTYINSTTKKINTFMSYTKNLSTYNKFNDRLNQNIICLQDICNKLDKISNYNVSLKKTCEIGYILKCFYELNTNSIYHDEIMYSFGFNSFNICIYNLKNNILNKHIQFCNFVKNRKNVSIKDNYYAVLKNNNPIKNDIKFKKNIIITGPNASGKTTILKSTLINIILSQQFGCGFYSSANIKPFRHISCYLNIPDTSGRDSLFQSEVRRCKNIIDIIKNDSSQSHFCVFDELFSGTNPEEAVMSAYAFMKYICNQTDVVCMLTTHFTELCKKLNKCKNISNCHMLANRVGNSINYKYKIKKGISSLKGGVCVLNDMNYPQEIIKDLEFMIKQK